MLKNLVDLVKYIKENTLVNPDYTKTVGIWDFNANTVRIAIVFHPISKDGKVKTFSKHFSFLEIDTIEDEMWLINNFCKELNKRFHEI